MIQEYRRELRAMITQIEGEYGPAAAFLVTEHLTRAHDALRVLAPAKDYAPIAGVAE